MNLHRVHTSRSKSVILYTVFLETLVLVYRLGCMFLTFLGRIWTKSGLSSLKLYCSLRDPSNPKPQKIPHHLSLVLFEDSISLPDVANLIYWSFEFGVSVLSLCDIKGQIVHQCEKFHRILEERKLLEDWKHDVAERYTYRFKIENDGHCRDIDVHYHTINYGLENMCEVARTVCQSPQTLSDEDLAEVIYRTSALPDVELTIHFGTFSSLLGLFPWHSRWSEFLNMSTHWHIQKVDFLRTVSRFGDIKQRWGR